MARRYGTLYIFDPALEEPAITERLDQTARSPHMIASTGYGCRPNDSASELGTWVPGK